MFEFTTIAPWLVTPKSQVWRSNLNKADGVEANTWLPSGDQERKVTPPPPTLWSGTQDSAATSQTWKTHFLSIKIPGGSRIFIGLVVNIKQPLRTIMDVSIGEADKRRAPLGDQAMDVTGAWPGWDNTWAQLDEGLKEIMARKKEKKSMSDKESPKQYKNLYTDLWIC